ncbi:MAG: GNAT family N-acetyltransferase [Alphaproteobacteria bacterium]
MEASKQRNIVIRRARNEDLPALIDLDEAVTGVRKADYWSHAIEHYRRKPDERAIFVAEDAVNQAHLGSIAGEVGAWEFGSAPCGWIFAILVDPESRQGYVGTGLLEAMLDLFRRAGITQMRTMVSRDNVLLMAFFRSQGMMAGPYLELEMDIAPQESQP